LIKIYVNGLEKRIELFFSNLNVSYQNLKMKKVYIGGILFIIMEEENWKLITLKVPPNMLNTWNLYAKSQGIKRSELIRDSVNDNINPNDKKQDILMDTIDKIIKLYVNGLEKRIMVRFQRIEAHIQAFFDMNRE
jgi:hypothetical protein